MPNRPEITELTLVRRANILQLVKDGGWDRKQFSEKSGIKYATLSGWLGEHPKANIGDKMATAIEAVMNKPPGWLNKDRRGQAADDDNTTITLQSANLTLTNFPISKYQRDTIVNLLFGD